MIYDIQSIKERLDLTELMRRDGHTPRRMGSRWVVSCPFHEEKTASCTVAPQRFHCFGCGAGTDVFDYWERSRGVSKKDAIAQLASLAGIGPQADGWIKPVALPAPKPRQEELVLPLTAQEQADWFACVDELRARPHEIRRIAEWRGIDGDVIRWANERGVIGLKKWSGVWREAFLVEMPESPAGPLVPVSTHIRLAPDSRGNPHRKASWRFDPAGRGGWPLVFGDPATCTHLFILEGQWDALALVHLMRWHLHWPEGTCLVAMRGATSFRSFLSHYTLHEKATVFAIADADNAGAEWFRENGLVHQLSAKVRIVHAFWPGARGLDFNDLVLRGLTRDELLHILRPKLRSPRHRKPTAPTFLAWCKRRSGAPDPLGRAARAVIADESRPSGRKRKTVWMRHWRKLDLTDDLTADLSAAWDTYKSECTLS